MYNYIVYMDNYVLIVWQGKGKVIFGKYFFPFNKDLINEAPVILINVCPKTG